MPPTILLRGANQLLTLRGPRGARRGAALSDLGIIADGSMLIRDGCVLSVGPSRRIENLKEARAALEIPVYGKVVMPGLVDAALHLSLRRSQHGHKLKRVADFHDDSLALLRSCLQHGTVTAEVHASADGRDFHADIAVLRKLAKIGSNPVRMTRTWRIGCEPDISFDPANLEDRRITFDTLLRRRLIDAISISPQTVRELDLDLLAAAGVAGLSLKLSWPGGDPALFRALVQQLDPQSVTFAGTPTVEEAVVLAGTRAIAIVPAGKQVFEGQKGTGGRDLVDAGAAIALSSGYNSTIMASSSMQMSIALAVARLGLSPEEAFSAATINAAHAAACGHVTGSLECGKQADVLVLDISDYRELPLQFGINHVAMIFRQGSIVLNRTRWRAPVEQPANRVRTEFR